VGKKLEKGQIAKKLVFWIGRANTRDDNRFQTSGRTFQSEQLQDTLYLTLLIRMENFIKKISAYNLFKSYLYIVIFYSVFLASQIYKI
jgi:hypothetical protein